MISCSLDTPVKGENVHDDRKRLPEQAPTIGAESNIGNIDLL